MRNLVLFSTLAAMAGGPSMAAAPGTLSDAQPAIDAPAGMQAWRVRYWTTSDKGREIEVSGMVIAPREAIPQRPRKVLVWTHGTTGVVEKCAPSNATWAFNQIGGLIDAISRGYAVVAPDYAGLGSGGPHPYLVGESTGRSVLDAVRASRSIPGAASGSDFAVWGLSQGGHAALWTGQLAGRYAPDLRLVGVAAAAPPTDLALNLAAGRDASVRAFLTAFTAYSWSEHYGAPLASLGNRSTQGIIQRLARNNCASPNAKPKLGTIVAIAVLRRDLKNVDLGKVQPWARFAKQNSPASRPYGVPFLIAQNEQDAIVAASVTKGFARRLCRAGGTVRYLSVVGKGHETTAADSAATTLDWINARFAGARAPTSCDNL